MNEMMQAIEKFLQKQEEAEARGEHHFMCPICGGDAYWSRLTGHLHCGCRGCGIRMAE